jgi:S-adenosyl methyltransferase
MFARRDETWPTLGGTLGAQVTTLIYSEIWGAGGGLTGWEDRTPPSLGRRAVSTNNHAVAQAARMYDYLAGGTTHFEVDRQAVARASTTVGGLENARADVRANRAFLGRVVQWLAGPCGIRQFLDMRLSDGRGVSAFVAGDLRDPDHVLDAAARTLDLTQPVALLLISVLHLIEDEDDPRGIVRRLVDALAPASYLALSHLTADITPAAMRALVDAPDASARELVMRDHLHVSQFFDGLDLILPGVVQVDQWRPGRLAPPPSDGAWVPSFYGGVARTSVWPAGGDRPRPSPEGW